MERQIAILNSNGSFPLPQEAQSSLGLHAGSRLAVSIEDGRIVLQPVPADDLDELCGIFSSTPGLADDLKEWRGQDKW